MNDSILDALHAMRERLLAESGGTLANKPMVDSNGDSTRHFLYTQLGCVHSS